MRRPPGGGSGPPRRALLKALDRLCRREVTGASALSQDLKDGTVLRREAGALRRPPRVNHGALQRCGRSRRRGRVLGPPWILRGEPEHIRRAETGRMERSGKRLGRWRRWPTARSFRRTSASSGSRRPSRPAAARPLAPCEKGPSPPPQDGRSSKSECFQKRAPPRLTRSRTALAALETGFFRGSCFATLTG